MITPILLCTYHDQTRLIDNQLTIKIDYTHAFLKSARIEHNRPVGGCRALWVSGGGDGRFLILNDRRGYNFRRVRPHCLKLRHRRHTVFDDMPAVGRSRRVPPTDLSSHRPGRAHPCFHHRSAAGSVEAVGGGSAIGSDAPRATGPVPRRPAAADHHTLPVRPRRPHRPRSSPEARD